MLGARLIEFYSKNLRFMSSSMQDCHGYCCSWQRDAAVSLIGHEGGHKETKMLNVLQKYSTRKQAVRVSELVGLSAIGCVRLLVESRTEAAAAANLQMLIWALVCRQSRELSPRLLSQNRFENVPDIYLNVFRPDRMDVFWRSKVTISC